MTSAYVVDVSRQRVEELGRVEAVACLKQFGFLVLVAHHLRQACQRLADAAHLAGDIHIPHLIAVAGALAAFLLRSVLLHVGAVVHAVPHPQSHVLGNGEGLVGYGLVVKQVGDVDESGELLVHRVVGCPHSVGVVVWGIFLDEGAVLGGNGVDISVAILLILLFICVEVAP